MTFTAQPTTQLDTLSIVDDLTLEGMTYLRVDSTELATVRSMVLQVMGQIETYCRQPIFERTYTTRQKAFTDGMLASLTARDIVVKYRLAGDVIDRTLAVSAYEVSDMFEISFIDPPKDPLFVEIQYKAGYTPDDLPGGIKTALFWKLTDIYDSRADGRRDYNPKSDRLLHLHRLSV